MSMGTVLGGLGTPQEEGKQQRKRKTAQARRGRPAPSCMRVNYVLLGAENEQRVKTTLQNECTYKMYHSPLCDITPDIRVVN